MRFTYLVLIFTIAVFGSTKELPILDAFIKVSGQLSKRSCSDCEDFSEEVLDACGYDTVTDTDNLPELYECLCGRPASLYDTFFDCVQDCDGVVFLGPTDMSGEELKRYFCEAAVDIKTYTGDFETYTYRVTSRQIGTPTTTATQILAGDDSNDDRETTSSNSANIFGTASVLAMVILWLL